MLGLPLQAQISGALVRYDTNRYSVPIQFCGKSVSIKALPERIEIFHGGEMIAVHQRCFGHQEGTYSLDHYLPLLEREGRAIFQTKPVRQNVPQYFLDWLRQQDLRPKELVALLKLSLEIGFEAVMHGTTPVKPIPEPVIPDEIQAVTVDLAAYEHGCNR